MKREAPPRRQPTLTRPGSGAGNPMVGIDWNRGTPPRSVHGRLLLLVATPGKGNHDIAEDNRPGIYIGHWKHQEGWFPVRVWGMNEANARSPLNVMFWAELDGPPGVELRALTENHISG